MKRTQTFGIIFHISISSVFALKFLKRILQSMYENHVVALNRKHWTFLSKSQILFSRILKSYFNFNGVYIIRLHKLAKPNFFLLHHL